MSSSLCLFLNFDKEGLHVIKFLASKVSEKLQRGFDAINSSFKRFLNRYKLVDDFINILLMAVFEYLTDRINCSVLYLLFPCCKANVNQYLRRWLLLEFLLFVPILNKCCIAFEDLFLCLHVSFLEELIKPIRVFCEYIIILPSLFYDHVKLFERFLSNLSIWAF